MTWRRSNNQWSGGIAVNPAPKIPSAKIRWKISRFDFLGSRWHPPHYPPKGQTINAEYYSSLLLQLKNILKEKRGEKLTKVVLFLHDNAPAHRAFTTQKKLAYLGFQYLDHPPYSPDPAPSDYYLFSGLKKKFETSPFFVRRGHYFWVACKFRATG